MTPRYVLKRTAHAVRVRNLPSPLATRTPRSWTRRFFDPAPGETAWHWYGGLLATFFGSFGFLDALMTDTIGIQFALGTLLFLGGAACLFLHLHRNEPAPLLPRP